MARSHFEACLFSTGRILYGNMPRKKKKRGRPNIRSYAKTRISKRNYKTVRIGDETLKGNNAGRKTEEFARPT